MQIMVHQIMYVPSSNIRFKKKNLSLVLLFTHYSYVVTVARLFVYKVENVSRVVKPTSMYDPEAHTGLIY